MIALRYDLRAIGATLRAFQESRILLTAVELNVFTAIRHGVTAEQAARSLGVELRGLTALLNAFVSMGLVQKHDGVYSNLPLAAERLVEGSPGCARAGILHDAHRWHTWSRLTEIARGVANPEEHRSLEQARHRALLALRNGRASERAPKLVPAIGPEGVGRVLEISGCSAAYSIAFVRAAP